jgi:hypothetical protein
MNLWIIPRSRIPIKIFSLRGKWLFVKKEDSSWLSRSKLYLSRNYHHLWIISHQIGFIFEENDKCATIVHILKSCSFSKNMANESI